MKSELAALALKVFHVGWMSVGLALLLEVLVLVLILATGNDASPLSVTANALGRVSWSLVVCAALAITTALPRAALPASGLTGLLVAPATTVVVKTAQKVITQAMTGAVLSFPWGVVLSLALLKGIEYAWLGAVLAWLGKRDHGFFEAISVATVTGFVFGMMAATINAVFAQMSPSLVFVSFVNEMLFPIGCSIILFGADRLARLMAPSA